MRSSDFEHEGREHAVSLDVRDDGTVKACISNDEEKALYAFTVTRLASGRYLVRTRDAVRELLVERAASGSVVVRFPEGSVVLEPLDPFRNSLRRGRAGAGGARKVTAPIPGRVVDVLVALGDMVAAGQPLVVVEAMKMANELRAPIAGRITHLAVTRGQPVEAGSLLLTVEP